MGEFARPHRHQFGIPRTKKGRAYPPRAIQESSYDIFPSEETRAPRSENVRKGVVGSAARLAIAAAIKYTGSDTLANLVISAVKGYRVFKDSHSLRKGLSVAFSEFANVEANYLVSKADSLDLQYLTESVAGRSKKPPRELQETATHRALVEYKNELPKKSGLPKPKPLFRRRRIRSI